MIREAIGQSSLLTSATMFSTRSLTIIIDLLGGYLANGSMFQPWTRANESINHLGGVQKLERSTPVHTLDLLLKLPLGKIFLDNET
jgi:hypothetical protein